LFRQNKLSKMGDVYLLPKKWYFTIFISHLSSTWGCSIPSNASGKVDYSCNIYLWTVIFLLICIWGPAQLCDHSSSSQEFVTVGINLGTVWSLFYYWTSKLINLLLFPSFPNSHHLHANFPNYKGPIQVTCASFHHYW
jgi:hypothetical protein